jgi:hypothetical protein
VITWWGDELDVCTRPEVHDPDHVDHIPVDDLAARLSNPTPGDAAGAAEGGARTPASRPRPSTPPRWEPSERLIEEVRRRLADELGQLSEPVRQLLVWVCNLDVADDTAVDDVEGGLLASFRWSIWERLGDPARWAEDEGEVARMWLWVLAAVVDVGEPLPTLDQVTTRLDVLTRGETAGEGAA